MARGRDRGDSRVPLADTTPRDDSDDEKVSVADARNFGDGLDDQVEDSSTGIRSKLNALEQRAQEAKSNGDMSTVQKMKDKARQLKEKEQRQRKMQQEDEQALRSNETAASGLGSSFLSIAESTDSVQDSFRRAFGEPNDLGLETDNIFGGDAQGVSSGGGDLGVDVGGGSLNVEGTQSEAFEFEDETTGNKLGVELDVRF